MRKTGESLSFPVFRILNFMNKKIKKHISRYNCFIVAGDRGAGKSSILALFSDVFSKMGYKIYSQYPYQGVFQIPMVERCVNGVVRRNVDKQWLYSHKFQDSVILLDEGKNIWPARGWAKWTEADDDFFDFIRKNNTIIVICTLAYDCLDINVKRASDVTLYLDSSFWHFSYVESYRTKVVPVYDKNSGVFSHNNKGLSKITWEVCVVPLGHFYFWRKPYYNKFLTLYVADEKPEVDPVLWSDDFFKL